MKNLLIALVLFAGVANSQSIFSGNATKLRGRPIAATAPTDTQTLCWDNAGTTWKPCAATSGGTGNMLLTSGASDPSGVCVAGTAFYLQQTLQDVWFCPVSGTWKKFLSTLNTGTFAQVGLAGTVPATPAAGFVTEYFDSTAKVPQSVDDAGAKGTMVRPLAAVASNWLRSVGTNGTPTASQPAFTDISGAATGAQLPVPAVATKGGIFSKTCSAGDFVSTIGTDSSVTCGTPGGGGGTSLGVAWGYDGGTSVPTSATTLCTVSVPANTLGTGGTAGHALSMKFALYNNVGTGALSYTVNYGASSYTLVASSTTSSSTVLYGEILLANDLGVTNAQTLALVSQSKSVAGVLQTTYEFSQVLNEPNQNSASGTLDFSLKATAATTTQNVRVFMCSIKLL